MTTNVPHDAPPALRQSIAAERGRILARHGAAAFTLPRDAAVVHECGHAVVVRTEGFSVSEVAIWQADARHWVGRCVSDARQVLDAGTSAADLLMHARIYVAGLAAERLTGRDRPGSALEELGVSRMMTEAAASRLGVVDAYALWIDRVWDATIEILRRNSVPFDRLAALLAEWGIVKGGQLRRVLAAVRR